MKLNRLSALLRLGCIFGFFSAFMLAGCGSEINPDFEPFSQHPFSGGEHQQYLQQQNWDIQYCYNCHTDPAEPLSVSQTGSCINADCHAGSLDGPEACNTCHGQSSGDAANPLNWAPPAGLRGNTSAIGAHAAHLFGKSGLFRAVECRSCHIIPDSWNDDLHIEDDSPGRVEVLFSSIATAGHAEPVYSAADGTCSATYCHGNATVAWDQEGGVTCGSCHGLPPQQGHPSWPSLNQCYYCHAPVIDSSGSIVTPTLHLNGFVN